MRYEMTVDPLQQVIKFYDSDKGESAEGQTRYSMSMLCTELGLRECRLHLVQGELNHDINMMMFGWAKKQGYKKVQMEVPEGTPCTRLAKYSHTVDGLDRYIVNL